MMRKMKLTIKGEVLSHKNLWKRAKWGGMYNSQPEAFNGLLSQLVRQKAEYTNLPIITDCRLVLSLWGDNRKDLNNQIATLCDLLEKAEIIKNDRQIKDIQAKIYINNKNPHAEIELSTIDTEKKEV